MTLYDNPIVIGEARAQALFTRIGSNLAVAVVEADPAPVPGLVYAKLIGIEDIVQVLVSTQLWDEAIITIPANKNTDTRDELPHVHVGPPLATTSAGDPPHAHGTTGNTNTPPAPHWHALFDIDVLKPDLKTIAETRRLTIAVSSDRLYEQDQILIINGGDTAVQPWYFLQLLARTEPPREVEGQWR